MISCNSRLLLVYSAKIAHHLTTTGEETSSQFAAQRDPARLGICPQFPHKIVDGQLDGFLRGHADQLGQDTTIERSQAAFVRVHLLGAVNRSFVQ